MHEQHKFQNIFILTNCTQGKKETCPGDHLAAMYGRMEGELLYLQTYSLLSLQSNFVQHVLPFLHGLKSPTHLGNHLINMHSYTPRTLRACCSQSKFRILKIRESSARALFLYNCTPNISRSADASVSIA